MDLRNETAREWPSTYYLTSKSQVNESYGFPIEPIKKFRAIVK